MELLAFILAVLAIAFVLAKAIGKRGARKVKIKRPIRASGFLGLRSAELRVEASELRLSSSLVALKAPPASPKPPLVDTVDCDLDWIYGSQCAGKTPGEILGMMFPQARLVEKQDWTSLKNSAESKKDLDLMLACCKAEIETSQSQLVFPQPECFKCVARLLRKRKDYSRELSIVELYWELCDSVYEEVKRRVGLRAQLMAQHSALKAGFQKRYDKARILLTTKSENAALMPH